MARKVAEQQASSEREMVKLAELVAAEWETGNPFRRVFCLIQYVKLPREYRDAMPDEFRAQGEAKIAAAAKEAEAAAAAAAEAAADAVAAAQGASAGGAAGASTYAKTPAAGGGSSRLIPASAGASSLDERRGLARQAAADPRRVRSSGGGAAPAAPAARRASAAQGRDEEEEEEDEEEEEEEGGVDVEAVVEGHDGGGEGESQESPEYTVRRGSAKSGKKRVANADYYQRNKAAIAERRSKQRQAAKVARGGE
jgi:hypothetical protein